MFVDTGISVLVERLAAQENVDTKKDWIVKAAGCGNPMGLKEVFKIGERNYRTLREKLATEEIHLTAEDVGGTAGRSVCLDLSSGQTIVHRNGTERVL